MTITESQIRESIEGNMDEFRAKALRGKVNGNDVAKLFGFEEMYNEGEELEKEFESLRDEVVSEMSKNDMLREREWEDNDEEFETVLDKARSERVSNEKWNEYINSIDVKPYKDVVYNIKTFCDDMCMMVTDEAHDVILDKEPVFGFGFKVNGGVKWIDFIDYNGIFVPFYNKLYFMDDYNDWMASPEVERILKKYLPLMNVSFKVIPKDFSEGESGGVEIKLELKDKKLYPYIQKRETELIDGKDTMGVDAQKQYEVDMMWEEYKHQKELEEKYKKDSDWNKVDGKGMEEVVTEAEEDEENEDTETQNSEDGGSENDSSQDDTQNDSNPEEEDDSKKGEENKEEPKDDKEKEENEKGPLKPGETTHLESFEELFNETDTKIKIQKQGIGPEPSPMFGQSSAKHNKYKISLTNDKGGDVSWIYWDSEKNTNDKIVPDTETVMKDFGLKLEAAVVGISFDKFKEEFGYDEIDNTLAQKQYEGLRKMKDNIKKIFPDQHNIYQLIQIAKKS